MFESAECVTRCQQLPVLGQRLNPNFSHCFDKEKQCNLRFTSHLFRQRFSH